MKGPFSAGAEHPESLGRRIADGRAKLGWTQQQLANRIGISRVALSHIESGVSTPGERTVALLAGVFKLEPYELVAGTSYPQAKVDRLPLVAARYTEAEMQVRLLERDLRGWEQVGLGDTATTTTLPPAYVGDELRGWLLRMEALAAATDDQHERSVLAEGRALVRAALDALG